MRGDVRQGNNVGLVCHSPEGSGDGVGGVGVKGDGKGEVGMEWSLDFALAVLDTLVQLVQESGIRGFGFEIVELGREVGVCDILVKGGRGAVDVA